MMNFITVLFSVVIQDPSPAGRNTLTATSCDNSSLGNSPRCRCLCFHSDKSFQISRRRIKAAVQNQHRRPGKERKTVGKWWGAEKPKGWRWGEEIIPSPSCQSDDRRRPSRRRGGPRPRSRPRREPTTRSTSSPARSVRRSWSCLLTQTCVSSFALSQTWWPSPCVGEHPPRPGMNLPILPRSCFHFTQRNFNLYIISVFHEAALESPL